MLVTNRDTYLADYSIKSYQKLIPVFKNYNWKLIVYLNCLKEEFINTYAKEWAKLSYVELVDNSKYVNREELIPGEKIKSESDEGWQVVEGKYEPCAVVWTREFKNFTSDYWVTVDADFEILSPDFIVSAFKMLEENNNLAVVSSDYNDNCYGFDSYSNENIVFMKRYNTWFCIYKKEAQKCKTSHFYYQEIVHGLRLAFDDAAKFQWDLREQFGYEMKAVDNKYRRSFIHYGAFSKNCSLDTPKKVSLFRKISIFSHRGLSGNNNLFDKIIRRFFKILCNFLYKKINAERGKVHHKSKLDE
jgi:hypothetical protein